MKMLLLYNTWQVADVLATFLVRNRLTVATDNFKWYLCCIVAAISVLFHIATNVLLAVLHITFRSVRVA